MATANRDVPTVLYATASDGSIDITVTNPDASSLRIDSYPEHIRTAVQAAFHTTITLDEMRKLHAAQDIGEPVYTAVWDDLVSARAEALMCTKSPSILPGKLENGHDALTSDHFKSYHEAELERGR